MPTTAHPSDRVEVLADVAELYFLEGLSQAEIAQQVGVTRSMVSRMLSEARHLGLVEFRVNRPYRLEPDLAARLKARFNLEAASVVVGRPESRERRLRRLGWAGAQALAGHLRPGVILGLAWGTAVSATVHALEPGEFLPSVKIIQLIGALGARIEDYDGHALVRMLETKLGGEGYYINAPFLVESPETALNLMTNRSIAETLTLARQCDVALLGIGSVDPEHSSFYRAGYVSLRELKALQRQGAVGDVCGRHFDAHGRACGEGFNRRLVGVPERALRGIPVRIGVAGGPGKVEAVRGAILGRYVNVLVTDDGTARALVDETEGR